jgi:hypothetical protein
LYSSLRRAHRSRCAPTVTGWIASLSSRSSELQSIPSAGLVPSWSMHDRPDLFDLHQWSSRLAACGLGSDDHSLEPSSHALDVAFRDKRSRIRPSTAAEALVPEHALPWGLGALRRLQERSSDLRQVSTPDCAAPSGFLNLLTRYSASNPSSLISCRWRP